MILTCNLVPEHILTLLMAYFTPNASQLTWNTDVFKQYFHGVTPEDTGFLFFEKVQGIVVYPNIYL